MIASNDMDDNKHISHSEMRMLSSTLFPNIRYPIRATGEIAQDDDEIGNHHSFPHGFLGGLFGGGRDDCLDLQHHIVAGIGKCYIAQGGEEVEDCSGCGFGLVALFHIRLHVLVDRSCPSNCRVRYDKKQQ